MLDGACPKESCRLDVLNARRHLELCAATQTASRLSSAVGIASADVYLGSTSFDSEDAER